MFPAHGNHHVTGHDETTTYGLGIIITATSPDRTTGQGGQDQHSVYTSPAEVGARNTVTATVTVTMAGGVEQFGFCSRYRHTKEREIRQPAYQQTL